MMDELCDTGKQCVLFYNTVYVRTEGIFSNQLKLEFINPSVGFLFWNLHINLVDEMLFHFKENNRIVRTPR